jgi:GNAT superfamily N-acetyltransferase
MEIRSIKPDDVEGVVRLMRAFAEFENLLDYCEITAEKLEKVLFGPGSFVESLVAFDDDGKLIAYSIFYPHFASFRGQTGYYLEDIFIDDSFRGQGLGEALLRTIANIASKRGFDRIDFQVLDWNTSAVNFYLKLGALRDDSERHFKFTDDAFKALAA